MVKKLLFVTILCISSIGFSQVKSMDKLLASPNPFSNSTTISFNSTNKQAIIFVVRNVLGKTVYSKKVIVKKGKNAIFFERNNLKSGMYIYTIQSKKEVISKRFVIK